MYTNRHHSHVPTRITMADRNRQTIAMRANTSTGNAYLLTYAVKLPMLAVALSALAMLAARIAGVSA